MIFTLNLRTLRPLRLCGRYSEFRLRLSRTGSFVVHHPFANFAALREINPFHAAKCFFKNSIPRCHDRRSDSATYFSGWCGSINECPVSL
jgi:hypothetical protein